MKRVALVSPLFYRLPLVVFLLLCHLPAALLAVSAFSETVTIREELGRWRISIKGDPIIEAQVGQDGSLLDLRFIQPGEFYGLVANSHRPSFVRLGTGLPDLNSFGGSRGFFLYQGTTVDLERVEQVDVNSLRAEGERASVHYHFAAEGVQIRVENKTSQPMQALMVIDPTVRAVASLGGERLRTPTVQLWSDTTWYQDGVSAWWQVQIEGGDRIWGPSEETGKAWRKGLFQVWEATLQPHEVREISITAKPILDEETAELKERCEDAVPGYRMAELAFQSPKPSVSGALTLFSPKDYQVFQRRSRMQGQVLLSGAVPVGTESLVYRFLGSGLSGELPDRWRELGGKPVAASFSEWVDLPAGGWYRLEMQARRGEEVLADVHVEHVGVGEVFVICGQSNSTNYGERRKLTARTQTGLVSSFSGESWSLSEDPQPGSTDGSQGGSPWTYFGDAMVARYQVPVAVAVTGHGGAPVKRWLPGKFPFYWLMSRIHQLGPNGFRALLWHQGEADAKGTSEAYYDSLTRVIDGTRSVAGWNIPWMVAQVSYTGSQRPLSPATRLAQQRIWDEGIALVGPDTDTLLGENRVGVHFSELGLKNHGELWAEKVGVYLDQVLEAEAAQGVDY
ncbi:sialate O-acetylesterase [Coraliomargarita algicola]|uniref:Sialate O-acetylesterase n=1 Tax=Coraliomargarita algicola TaxID=3092156 RepID=A0ABZ0RMK0_9BACT|nr:sialate O-acetylesterase [Coraliomargarita sp. J2-16]WPJ96732.1 sialate O-acetylesterase [Coraliomargarita sp. J2-16]